MEIVPAVILIVVAAIAGYLIGIFDSRLTQTVQKKLEENSKPVEETPKDPNAPGEHTVLKVTVDTAIKWHLELDGSRLEDPGAITPEQRQRLVNVVVQMRPWIDGKTAQGAVPAPASQPASEQPPLKSLSASTAVQIPVSPPSQPKIDAIRGLRSLLKNEIKTPDQMKSVSLVAMIDDVLQAKLSGTPFVGKGIRLEEGSFGEVIVYVGASRYSGVDAVPDPEIQALIKSSIADWEKR
jgi:cell division protein FtsN